MSAFKRPFFGFDYNPIREAPLRRGGDPSIMRTQIVACAVCSLIAVALVLFAVQLALSPAFIASVMGAFMFFLMAIGFFIDARMS
jgi:hypothetical protein